MLRCMDKLPIAGPCLVTAHSLIIFHKVVRKLVRGHILWCCAERSERKYFDSGNFALQQQGRLSMLSPREPVCESSLVIMLRSPDVLLCCAEERAQMF